MRKSSRDQPASAPRRRTLADLARELGVDTSTISLALRDSPKVSAGMKAKIRALASKRRYVPNAHARALAGGRSALLGVILPCSGIPFYSMMLDLLYEQAAKRSLRVEAQFHQWDEKLEASSFRTMTAHRAEGIVSFSPPMNPLGEFQEDLFSDTGIPTSFWGPLPKGLPNPSGALRGFVTVNVRKGARMAAEHLLGLGHRRIALMPYHRGSWLSREARSGIEEAMQLHPGAELVPVSLPKTFSTEAVGAEKTFAGGLCVAGEFLRLDPLPTAAITTDDTHAHVLMSALASRGLRVPENLSVVCSGNTYYARYGAVPLSCVSMPLAEIAEKLVALVTEPTGDNPASEHVFQPEFIPRMSTAVLTAK
ncbi:MAG: LacI family DNA-binding transcriptional regulator [Chthoniobacterales bacterium]|nr:LacI family DNA-binding transcriptional regulator [Chthoniobacterales bacterium]